MNKRRITFLIIASLALAFTSPQTAKSASDPIHLQVSIYDPTLQHGENPKSPIEPPSISLDNHTLYFDTPCDGCTLNIVDENDLVVYTLVIPMGTTSLVLPSTLSGEYELQIISGYYCFWGVVSFE